MFYIYFLDLFLKIYKNHRFMIFFIGIYFHNINNKFYLKNNVSNFLLKKHVLFSQNIRKKYMKQEIVFFIY